jgi:ribose 5-phosphate isomerase B
MIYLATDHTGFILKEKVKQQLIKDGYEVEDCGAFENDPNDDYPDFIAKAAQKVSENPENFGIVMGGSGQGEAITSNKFPNVRCATFYTPSLPKGDVDISGNKSTDPYEILKLTRAHNNSNMLSLGVRFLTEDEAVNAVKIFLKSPFTSEERHSRRIEKIKKIEESL